MENAKYIDFVNSNAELLARAVDDEFEAEKNKIRASVIEEIESYLDPVPPHYEWRHDGCPWDCSGELVERGVVSLDQTVSDFLEDEYSGRKEPTFERGRGWNYLTFGDDLSYVTANLGYDILLSVIRHQLEKYFGEPVSDEQLDDIKTECYDFDRIYENTRAFEFFLADPAVEFCGLKDVSLREILSGSI